MDAIYLLIPIALILVVIAVVVFLWAVKSDQFEDLEGPAHSILFDDDITLSKQNNIKKNTDPQASNDSDTNSTER